MSETGNKIGVVPRREVEVGIAVIFDAGRERVLICKRKAEAVLGGYWEFPGGKCEAGERAEDCARREAMEETGLEVRVVRALSVIVHEYPHARVRIHPFLCEHVGGELELRAVADARWIRPGEITGYEFPEANRGLVAQIGGGMFAGADAKSA